MTELTYTVHAGRYMDTTTNVMITVPANASDMVECRYDGAPYPAFISARGFLEATNGQGQKRFQATEFYPTPRL